MTHTKTILACSILAVLTIATVIYNEQDKQKKETQRRADMYVYLEDDLIYR